MRDSSTEIQTSGLVTQAENSKTQTENQSVNSVIVTESSKSQTGTSGTKQHTGSILNKAQSKVKHTKSSNKTNLNAKKGTGTRFVLITLVCCFFFSNLGFELNFLCKTVSKLK